MNPIIDEAWPDEPKAPTSYALMILGALQKKPMYAGTVPTHVKAHRRAAGRVAKQSRKVNRGK